jgi:putative PIN family toxin of toxin-antitoxin system
VRVVLDANVLLAGVFTRGVCELVLDACWENAPTIVVVGSEFLLGEFAGNAESKFGVPRDKAMEETDLLRRRMEIVEPGDVPADACRDKGDLPILGTAEAGAADFLITGDRDLLDPQSFRGIPILSPREFYDYLVDKF